MYKVCSTLINSLEESFKAIRRKLCNTTAKALTWALYGVVTKTAKYFTKEELEDLKEKGEELNNVISVKFEPCIVNRKCTESMHS